MKICWKEQCSRNQYSLMCDIYMRWTCAGCFAIRETRLSFLSLCVWNWKTGICATEIWLFFARRLYTGNVLVDMYMQCSAMRQLVWYVEYGAMCYSTYACEMQCKCAIQLMHVKCSTMQQLVYHMIHGIWCNVLGNLCMWNTRQCGSWCDTWNMGQCASQLMHVKCHATWKLVWYMKYGAMC
jgi:hypothetical protein